MKTVYIGLDIHSKRTTFFMQDEEGKEIAKGVISTTEEGLGKLKENLQDGEKAIVGLESGNMARYVVDELRKIGLESVVIEAREVRVKARRINQKSDMRDAYEICDGIRRGIYTSLVHMPDESVEKLRKILSRRRHFVKLATSQVNAAKRLLRAEGLGSLYKSLESERAWEALLEKIKEREELHGYVTLHRETWSLAKRNKGLLEENMKEAQEPFKEQSQRLQTIPGIGWITALTAVAVLSDVGRFPTVKQATSYVGIVPQTYQSGDNDRHGHITKRGSSDLRALLVEAAHHASRPQHPLNPYIAKLAAKRGYKMAVVAVAHRMLRIMVAMLKQQCDFDVGKLNVEAKVHKVSRTRYYRMKKKETRAEA